MSVMVSANFAKALWPGVNSFYGQSYAEHNEEYTELFDSDTSSRAYEEDVGVSGFGLAAQKTEANGITYDEERQAFLTRYSHIVYALGFQISRELFEDDQYGIVGKRRAKGLAFSMRQTKEIVGANVYNRAFSSTYAGGDGKEMCATDHPNYAGGTWANELTTAADLSESALEQAINDLSKWENDRGLKIAVMPTKLIIPSDLQFEAERILMTPYRSGTSDNDINALKTMGKIPQGFVINHYLTDPDAWFIRTNSPEGLKFFQRRSMQFGIDNDFDTENAKFKATERYSCGWTDPRGIFGSPGA